MSKKKEYRPPNEPVNPVPGRPFYKVPFPPETIEKVKRDWIVGMPIKHIQAKYHINDRNTIFKWIKKGNWKEIKDKMEVKVKEKFADKMADWMIQQAQIGKMMQNKGKIALEYKDPEKIKVFEATDLIRTGADIERKALAPEEKTKTTNAVMIFLPQIENQPDNIKTIDAEPDQQENVTKLLEGNK